VEQGEIESWAIVDEDPDAGWQVRVPTDFPRNVVGISNRAERPLICCWGSIREVSDGQWAVWLVSLSAVPTEVEFR
jgi:hypothetical protein